MVWERAAWESEVSRSFDQGLVLINRAIVRAFLVLVGDDFDLDIWRSPLLDLQVSSVAFFWLLSLAE